jgi:hypothetical protein
MTYDQERAMQNLAAAGGNLRAEIMRTIADHGTRDALLEQLRLVLLAATGAVMAR